MARPSVGGMLATRQGALILALLCAVCAAGILMFALGQYKTSIKPVTTQATVLVATAEIPAGTNGSEVASHGLYKAMPVTTSQLAPGAISDAAALNGKTVSTNILPGQQLTATDFSGVTGVAGLLTPDQRAISLTIAEAPGNNDVLQAGNHVDVYADFKSSSNVTSVVLLDPNVQVIKSASGTASASGSSTTTASSGAGSSSSTVSGSSLVLAVSGQQASDLVFAAQNATLYLTLRPDNGTASPRQITTIQSVIRDAVAVVNPSSGAHK